MKAKPKVKRKKTRKIRPLARLSIHSSPPSITHSFLFLLLVHNYILVPCVFICLQKKEEKPAEEEVDLGMSLFIKHRTQCFDLTPIDYSSKRNAAVTPSSCSASCSQIAFCDKSSIQPQDSPHHIVLELGYSFRLCWISCSAPKSSCFAASLAVPRMVSLSLPFLFHAQLQNGRIRE